VLVTHTGIFGAIAGPVLTSVFLPVAWSLVI